MSEKKYKIDFVNQLGKINIVSGLGDTNSLRAYGINGDSPIKKACQKRLKRLFK